MQLYYRELLFLKRYYVLVQDMTEMSVVAATVSSRVVVTSASRGVIRPLSRGLFLIRDDKRVRRDGRVEVGLTPRLILGRVGSPLVYTNGDNTPLPKSPFTTL
jgi:hypothetical protein